jgi:ribosomal-protein-alanine N-acetyltransferase
MTPEALAALHGRCFDAAPRPWDAAEFAALLEAPGTLLVTRAGGFALGRVVGPEAEILTLAVDPAARRRGIATRLVAELEGAATARGAREAFLEVAADNAAARALYTGLGYAQAGLRRDYYGSGTDALVLTKILPEPAERHGKTI